MVRLIQVGLGNWGFSWTREVIPRVAAAEPVAYVDASPEAIRRVQGELGVDPALCFSSLAEAVEAVDAELVLATLRTEAHFPVARAALEAGLNVLVEKPFASTMAEAKALVALAAERDRVLMVSQNYRFQPAPILAAELIEAEALGPVNLVGIEFRRHAPTQGYIYWDFPDPLLADMSIHHFDLMRMVLGDNPKAVSCRTWNAPSSPFLNHPIGVATIEFERGTIVSYRGSWMSGGDTTPWAGEWTMDCSDGEIWWTSRDHFGGKQGPDRLIMKRRGEAPEERALSPAAHTDRAGTLDAICRAIASGTDLPRFSSGADNLWSFALVQASIQSALRGGEWIDVAEVLA
jgi:predicted dehydrogenase